ncbi:MAG: DUF445 domain-containing protein [Saprospiraceae bacterium]
MELAANAVYRFFEAYTDWLGLAIIPFSAALIGWLTNKLAIWMTFYPLERTGFTIAYWQGIIPSRAGKMAGISVDLMVGKLIDLNEIFAKIKPEIITEQLYPSLEPISIESMDKALNEKMPLPWFFLPNDIKKHFFKDAKKEIPHTIEATIKDIQEHIEEIFDVKSMIIQQLEQDKALLNEIFLSCGEKEFKFLERSGLYFGFLFGLIQMVLWYYIQDFQFSWIILPIGGLAVGYLTNWLALKLIFKPTNPIKLGFITIQGLFLKRQKAVAATYAEIVSKKILTTKNIFEAIFNGKNQNLLHSIIRKNVEKAVDNTAGSFRSIVQLLTGRQSYTMIKHELSTIYLDFLPKAIHQSFDYMDEAIDMENTLNDKMSNLTSSEFEGFLHPVFEEDELKLILVGAILGLFAGFLQMLFLV